MGTQLVMELLFVCSELVNFLTGSQHVMVDGGDESKGNGVNGFIDV